MDTETYGGSCPHCKKPMLMKYSTSSSALLFDCCIHCGFIYGTYFDTYNGVTDIEGEKSVDTFLNIIDHHAVHSIEELRNIFQNHETDDEIYPSVFDYSKDSKEEISSRIVDLDNLPTIPHTKHRL